VLRVVVILVAIVVAILVFLRLLLRLLLVLLHRFHQGVRAGCLKWSKVAYLLRKLVRPLTPTGEVSGAAGLKPWDRFCA
jgi:hypothetical protein